MRETQALDDTQRQERGDDFYRRWFEEQQAAVTPTSQGQTRHDITLTDPGTWKFKYLQRRSPSGTR
jgi:hypothetical protein